MKVVFPTYCVVDVHIMFLVAIIITPADSLQPHYQKKRFSTFNPDLNHFADWLLERGRLDRQLLTKLLTEQHKKHPSHGYHMLAKAVFEATGWVFSHNLAHKCCKQAAIRSMARTYVYKKAEEEHVKFPHEVKGNWNATRPIEIVVSDMTIFKNNGRNWEWTLLVDTFNNEILAHQATPKAAPNHITIVWSI